MSITRQFFCRWCIISYIYECAQLCPSSVLNLLEEYFSRTPHDGMHHIFALQNALSAIAKSRLDMSPKLAYLLFISTQLKAIAFISYKSLTLRSCLYWINWLASFACLLCCSSISTRCLQNDAKLTDRRNVGYFGNILPRVK